MAYQDIEYELKEGIVTVTMNRPDVMNALSENLEEEMRRLIKPKMTLMLG